MEKREIKVRNKSRVKSINRRPWLTLGLLAGGLLMIVLGLISGEYGNVLEKAITVCLDCIGIG